MRDRDTDFEISDRLRRRTPFDRQTRKMDRLDRADKAVHYPFAGVLQAEVIEHFLDRVDHVRFEPRSGIFEGARYVRPGVLKLRPKP